MLVLYLAKRNAVRAVTQKHNFTKKGQNSAKIISMLVHSVELSTVVVKVDIKVTKSRPKPTFTLQCVPPALTHAEIPRLRDSHDTER